MLGEFERLCRQVEFHQPAGRDRRQCVLAGWSRTRSPRRTTGGNRFAAPSALPIAWRPSIAAAWMSIWRSVPSRSSRPPAGRRCPTVASCGWRACGPGKDDWSQLLECVAELYVRGAPLDWEGFYQDQPRRRAALPNYPFQRSRYWVDGKARDARAGVDRSVRDSEASESLGDWLFEIQWQPRSRLDQDLPRRSADFIPEASELAAAVQPEVRAAAERSSACRAMSSCSRLGPPERRLCMERAGRARLAARAGGAIHHGRTGRAARNPQPPAIAGPLAGDAGRGRVTAARSQRLAGRFAAAGERSGRACQRSLAAVSRVQRRDHAAGQLRGKPCERFARRHRSPAVALSRRLDGAGRAAVSRFSLCPFAERAAGRDAPRGDCRSAREPVAEDPGDRGGDRRHDGAACCRACPRSGPNTSSPTSRRSSCTKRRPSSGSSRSCGLPPSTSKRTRAGRALPRDSSTSSWQPMCCMPRATCASRWHTFASSWPRRARCCSWKAFARSAGST